MSYFGDSGDSLEYPSVGAEDVGGEMKEFCEFLVRSIGGYMTITQSQRLSRRRVSSGTGGKVSVELRKIDPAKRAQYFEIRINEYGSVEVYMKLSCDSEETARRVFSTFVDNLEEISFMVEE